MKIVLSEKQIATAKELYAENKSLRQTAKHLDISRSALTRIFRENNIEINKSCVSKKPKFKEDFFAKIDTEKKAYWLGFLYADGYMDNSTKSIRIELKFSDRNHLVKFCTDIGYPDNRISYRKDRNTYYISICSKRLFLDLKNLGYKSYDMSIDKIPSDLHRHFIRGFYDGDGSIYGKGKRWFGTALIATKDHINVVYKLLPECQKKIRPVSKNKPQGMYRLETYSISASSKVCNYLYQNSTIYLERKYNKYIKYTSK